MNIAVSACLLGSNCRFDGESRPSDAVRSLRERHTVVPICPESFARLPIPRCPNEIVRDGNATRVVDSQGADHTEAFDRGARIALRRAQEKDCTLAVLKSKSPSCASKMVFDGTFSGTLVPGWGIAAALFRDAGIRVMDEKDLERIAQGCGGCPGEDDLAARG